MGPRTARRAAWMLAGVLAGWLPASAQSHTGEVVGTVKAIGGDSLIGATVTLTGLGPERVAFADRRGEFRFVGLDPGRYRLEARLDGYGAVQRPEVEVGPNRSTVVPLVMTPALEEMITVTSERPLLDESRILLGADLDQPEIDDVPTNRDPYSIVNRAPGVTLSTVNVGGVESDSEPVFHAPGASNDQNDWVLDGVAMTDMRSTGLAVAHFDFNQLSAVQVTTGGTDVTKATAGVRVNLVTRRGANEARGSVRLYETRGAGYLGGALREASSALDRDDMGPGQSLELYRGKHTQLIQHVGFEAGGAVKRDRLWLWGTWGKQDYSYLDNVGPWDHSVFEHAGLKVNAQATRANAMVASWSSHETNRLGGATALRPEPTVWDLRAPAAAYRFEDSHVVSSKLFVSGAFALTDSGFAVETRAGAGPSSREAWYSAGGIWQDNFQSGSIATPTYEPKIDGSYFFVTGEVGHELRVGGRFRSYEGSSDFSWPGRNIFTFNTTRTHFIVARRGIGTPTTTDYLSLWTQDTINLRRLTINLGVRYDEQSGRRDAAVVPANPLVPEVLPALELAGADAEFSWRDVVPRLGLTYALGGERRTLVRASFAQFADQLGSEQVTRTNPAGEAYAYFVQPYVNAPYDGDGTELDDPGRVVFAEGFDPADPYALESPNLNDPDLRSPRTTELTLGIEHAFRPELVVGLSATLRRFDDLLEERTLVRDSVTGERRVAETTDYLPDGYLDGRIEDRNAGGAARDYHVPLFALRPELAFTGGSLLVNGSRERVYRGLALTVTKRLAKRWMLRGYLDWGQAEWRIDDEYRRLADPNRDALGSDRDGALYLVQQDKANGRGVRYTQQSWAGNLTGLVRIAPDRPWGFDLSASLQVRQGFPQAYHEQVVTSDGVARLVSVLDDLDAYRLGDVAVADLRAAKEVGIHSAMRLGFGIDVFNVTNESTDLSRIADLSSPRAYHLEANVAPRIYRLSVRLSWR